MIVLANRTTSPVPLQFAPVAGTRRNVTLSPGEVMPFFLDGRANVSFGAGGAAKRYLLDANAAYYFGNTSARELDLQKIGLGETPESAAGRPLPGHAESVPSIVIPVKLLVDEEEPGRRAQWERRLRSRIEAASAVLDKFCRVQLKVVSVETWNSDNATTDFFDSLAEFERDVKPFPARLAIGFTSQYQASRGRTHMAGTRGTLHSHILVREWSRTMSEPERLELLVHELGHHLGAAHSPEPASVMRPVLGNREAVRANFKVQFDPVNTLIMGLIGEEIRRRKIQSVATVSPGTKQRLSQIYNSLSPTMPDDPAAGHLNQMVRASAPQRDPPLVMATKQVLAGIELAAQSNMNLPPASKARPGQSSRREGDALAAHYVRHAAGMARILPEDVGPAACILGLGIGLDRGNSLRNHRTYGGFVQSVDLPRTRSLRVVLLGEPTMRGRRELAQQFLLSAYLAAAGGAKAAEDAVLAHELANANRPAGFRFTHIAAGRAGIRFAGVLVSGRVSLADVADDFSVDAYMPAVDDLPAGLSFADLAAQFGEPTDARFRQQLQSIDERISQLPAYRSSGIALER